MKREQEAQRTAREEKESRVAKLVPSLDPKRDHVRGPAGAEVTLVEYTDFECPFCKRFHEIPPRLLERYKGRLNWVIRNLPLPFHEPAAHREAFAAECVAKLGGNDKYWRYADMLFANTKSNGGGLPPEHSAQKLAADLDIQASAFDACMGDRAIARRVEEDVKSATAAGITGTPTSIVRDNRTGATRVIAGAQTLEEAEQAIESVLGASPGK
ncbi:MAG TPA: DsbA family protein [Usitatibacter sp.]|nr:DsbA family protein [Usitatibacter sp.]